MLTVVRNNDTQHVMVDRKIDVDGKHTETIKGDMSTTVKEGHQTNVVKTSSQTNVVKQAIAIKSEASEIFIEAKTQIVLKVGASSIFMKDDGTIEIVGKDIRLIATGEIVSQATGENVIKGSNVLINT
jgi:type VI secretion system secreted protein VgrG